MADNKNKPSLNEMIAQLSRWHSEVKNFRNDGYTQKAYREKIAAMRTQIIRITEDIRNSEELVEKPAFRSNPRETK
jgi:hypothetical protein